MTYKLPFTATKIEQMKLKAQATGSPERIADYAAAKAQYDALVGALFDSEETPLVGSPSESYVEQLAEAAKSGREDDMARYELMKERREIADRGINGQDTRDFKTEVATLRGAISSGEPLTQRHVEAARSIAARNPNPENMAVYSAVKAQVASENTAEA